MIIFGVEHQSVIVSALLLSRALLKGKPLPVLCLNLTTSLPLRIPYGKWKIWPGDSPFLLGDSENKRQASHLEPLSSPQVDFPYIRLVASICVRLFGWVKRKWLLSAVGEIQTEPGGKKECSTGHRGQMESLSSHRFRCCLHFIVHQPPVSPKHTFHSHNIQNTTRGNIYWWVQHPPPFLSIFCRKIWI